MRYSDNDVRAAREAMPVYLEAAHGITDLTRPFRCLHPDHEDVHPSMTYDRATGKVRCWSCGAHGDTIDVAGWDTGATDFGDKMETVAAATGIRLEGESNLEEESKAKAAARQGRKLRKKKPKPEPGPRTFEALGKAEQRRLTSAAYDAYTRLHDDPGAAQAREALQERGFTLTEVVAAGLGWVRHPADFDARLFPQWQRFDAPGGFIVLPFWDRECGRLLYCVLRPVGAGDGPKELKPSSTAGVDAQIWRGYLLNGPGRDVYATEGIYDAMALQAMLDATAPARGEEPIEKVLAICGTSNIRLLAREAGAVPADRRARISLAFDNDPAGVKAANEASALLKERGITHRVSHITPSEFKDANDQLKAMRLKQGGGVRW